MLAIGQAARSAGQALGGSGADSRNAALRAVADALRARAGDIVAANERDLAAAAASGLGQAVVKRLVLDAPKLESIIQGVEDVLALPDPLGAVTLARELAPGLELRRLSCPIGVLCIIFESRPEAVVQITSLALKSGNAVILKGGKEAAASNAALVDAIRGALASLPPAHASVVPCDAVQLVSTREEIADLLTLDTHIDVREAGRSGGGARCGRPRAPLSSRAQRTLRAALPAPHRQQPRPPPRSLPPPLLPRSLSSRGDQTSWCAPSRRPRASPCWGTPTASATCLWTPPRTRARPCRLWWTAKRSTPPRATPPRRCWFTRTRSPR